MSKERTDYMFNKKTNYVLSNENINDINLRDLIEFKHAEKIKTEELSDNWEKTIEEIWRTT